MGLEQFSERAPANQLNEITAEGGTLAGSLFYGQVAARVDRVFLSTTSAVDVPMVVSFSAGGFQFPILQIALPAGAGHGTAPPYELFTENPILGGGMVVGATESLDAFVPGTLAAGVVVQWVALGGTL